MLVPRVFKAFLFFAFGLGGVFAAFLIGRAVGSNPKKTTVELKDVKNAGRRTLKDFTQFGKRVLDKDEREKLEEHIKSVGEAAAESTALAWEKLKETATDGSATAKRGAAKTLGGSVWAAERTVPLLLKLLKDKDAEVRAEAARSLGALGTKAATAREELAHVSASDPNAKVRRAAAAALRNIPPTNKSR